MFKKNPSPLFFLRTTNVPDLDQYSHFMMRSFDEAPFIFTTSLTFCLGIAFYLPNDHHHSGKFAMYHSYSEHVEKDESFVSTVLNKNSHYFNRFHENQSGYFYQAVDRFFREIHDTSQVKITLHINDDLHKNIQTHDSETVLNCINTVLALHKKPLLDMNAISEQRGASAFFISNKGLTLSPARYDDYEPIAKEIYHYLLNVLRQKNIKAETLLQHDMNSQNNDNYLQRCYQIQLALKKKKFTSIPLIECFELLETPFLLLNSKGKCDGTDQILIKGGYCKNETGNWIKITKEKFHQDAFLMDLYQKKLSAMKHLADYLNANKNQLLEKVTLSKLIEEIKQTTHAYYKAKHKKDHLYYFFNSNIVVACKKAIKEFDHSFPTIK